MIYYFAVFIYVLTDRICISNQFILSGPVQVALPRTEGCISRSKQMFGNREFFGRIPRTELLCELWRSIAKENIIFWPWGYQHCDLYWQQILLVKNLTLILINNSYLKHICYDFIYWLGSNAMRVFFSLFLPGWY